MWLPFILQHIHFSLYIFGALSMAATAWLYVDAWKQSPGWRGLLLITGLSLLSISWLCEAVVVDVSVGIQPGFFGEMVRAFVLAIRIIGGIGIIVSLTHEPLVPRPNNESKSAGHIALLPIIDPSSLRSISAGASPLLLGYIALLYLRKSTIGLERHLRPVALAFAGFALAELFSLRMLFEHTVQTGIVWWVRPFGVLWVLQHLCFGAATAVLTRWIVSYLFKQFSAQLLMVFTVSILGVFLVTTVSFTGLLLYNMQQSALSQITTNIHVLEYALESQKMQLASDVQLTARDIRIRDDSTEEQKKLRQGAFTDMLLARQLSSLILVTNSGTVFVRAEDAERIGNSLSGDALVRRALAGETATSISTASGVIAPSVFLRAAAPIRDDTNTIVGAVIFGKALDTAFIDHMQVTTGLAASIYAGDTISATSLRVGTSPERAIGRKETAQQVLTKVLTQKQLYAGSLVVQNELYAGAYAPITDIDTNPVGMLFVGKEESAVWDAAGRSIQYTFAITVLLLIGSIVPAVKISRYLIAQL